MYSNGFHKPFQETMLTLQWLHIKPVDLLPVKMLHTSWIYGVQVEVAQEIRVTFYSLIPAKIQKLSISRGCNSPSISHPEHL